MLKLVLHHYTTTPCALIVHSHEVVAQTLLRLGSFNERPARNSQAPRASLQPYSPARARVCADACVRVRAHGDRLFFPRSRIPTLQHRPRPPGLRGENTGRVSTAHLQFPRPAGSSVRMWPGLAGDRKGRPLHYAPKPHILGRRDHAPHSRPLLTPTRGGTQWHRALAARAGPRGIHGSIFVTRSAGVTAGGRSFPPELWREDAAVEIPGVLMSSFAVDRERH